MEASEIAIADALAIQDIRAVSVGLMSIYRVSSRELTNLPSQPDDLIVILISRGERLLNQPHLVLLNPLNVLNEACAGQHTKCNIML